MGYVEENVSRKERVIYSTSLHWIIFLEAIGILLLGLLLLYLNVRYKEFLGEAIKITQYLAFAVLLFGGGKFVMEMIRLRSSEFVVTTERVLIKIGVLYRSSTSMPLNKIESVEIDQTIIGQMLNFGSIQITGTGTADSKFDLITNPHKFRRKMLLATGTSSEEERQAEIGGPRYVGNRRRRRR